MRYNYPMQRAAAFRAIYLAIDELARHPDDQTGPLAWWNVVKLAQDYGYRNSVTAAEVEAIGRMPLADLVSGGLE